MSDRIAGALNKSGATRVVALDISNVFDRVWNAHLLDKFRSYGISGDIIGLILLFSVIGIFGWFSMGILHRNIQLYRSSPMVHYWSYTFPNIQ